MVYTDNAGNKFLGNAIYSQGTSRLTGFPHNILADELIAFFSQANLKYRNIPNQTALDNFQNATGYHMFHFGFASDNIDDRFAFTCYRDGSLLNIGNDAAVLMFNNSGSPVVGNTPAVFGGNLWTRTNNEGWSGVLGTWFVGGVGLYNWIGVSDGESLALFYFRYDNSGNFFCKFYYAGRLADVNTTYAYYSSSIETSTVLFTDSQIRTVDTKTITNPILGHHRIAGARKQLLNTGDAQYPIVCSDGQSPTAQWATDFYVFDNNATLGYPAIGRVRNLLLAQGTYTIGKPVKIQGTVQPDNGFNAWLPIGTFGDKVVLMRCYSSASL